MNGKDPKKGSNADAEMATYVAATTDEFIAGMKLLLRNWNFPSVLFVELERQVRLFLVLEAGESSTDLISRLKWLCAYPMAKLCGEDLEKIRQPFSFSGKVRNWTRAHFKPWSDSDHKLWFSWFQLKRCTMTVPASFIKECGEKHRRAMERPPQEDNPDLLLVKKELWRLPRQYWNYRVSKEIAPSQSACLESGRKQGGAFSYLNLSWREWERENRLDPTRERLSVGGEGWYKAGRDMEGDVWWERSHPDSLQRYEDWLEQQCFESFSWSPLEARVEFVLEPLKVRTITKGPAALYLFGRCWQQDVHRALKSERGFELIGRPVTEDDILGLLPEEGLLEDWEFVSIDYSAATDNLEQELTMEALKTTVIEVGPTPSHEAWLRACVEPHLVSYPPKVKIEPVLQQNGQLMGSPVSFPLLCKINAATIKAADREFDTAGLPFLVNGDDALVYRPRGWRKVHERFSKSAGLTYSVGKVYCSRNYANVNSVGFWVEMKLREELLVPEAVCKRLDYVPVGLMRGHHKVSTTVTVDGEEEIAMGGVLGALRQTLAACTERPTFALRVFLSLNKGDLTRELKGRNLFICEPQGGIGLKPPQGWKYMVTDEQRALCCRATCYLWPERVGPTDAVRQLRPKAAKLEKRPFGSPPLWVVENDPWVLPAKKNSGPRSVQRETNGPNPLIGPWVPVRWKEESA